APSVKDPVIVTVPSFNFLMLDGKGDPNHSPAYQAVVEALYQFSYTLKFAIKKAGGVDYKVMPLEGLWWAEDMSDFIAGRRDDWLWTMLILQPEPVTPDWVEKTRVQLLAKKDSSPLCEKVRFETYDEGLSVQLMHIGPYAAEGPNIARMHAFANEQGCRLRGKHHEIYLSDPRRAAPEKMKTVLRQPVAA
nr:GyrI-like domain-containing protein [Anaerolinea sp.]